MKYRNFCLLLLIFVCLSGNTQSISKENSGISLTEHYDFKGWKNCLKLSNGSIDLVITTDVGPRILFFGYVKNRNMLYINPSDTGKTGGEEWRLYGGHRFWLSPEVMPFTYTPDNKKVKYTWDGKTLKLIQDPEREKLTVKEIEIIMSQISNEIEIVHRVINKGEKEIELAPWAITACATGSLAIVPQEPYIDPADYLLPSRPLVLWAYTKMTDPRYTWGEEYILAKQDQTIASETKFGVLNKQKWAALYSNKYLFVKTFSYNPEAIYPDYGCNNEIYINGDFIEVESLGALTTIAPQDSVEHCENWNLFDIGTLTSDDEVKLEQWISPVLDQLPAL